MRLSVVTTSRFLRHLITPATSRVSRGWQTRCQSQFFTNPTSPGEPVILYQAFSPHNHVRVVEIPDHPMVDYSIRELRGTRILVLDQSGNIHSIWKPGTLPDAFMTKSYWEFLATLPTLAPEGNIGILGLGAGTIARMIHAHYPERLMEGWELDPAVVMAARLYMGMDQVEATGKLKCHTGDALDPGATVEGGFSGILVDIFANGTLLPQLTQEESWHGIRQRLRPGVGARVMVNLGMSPRGVNGRLMHPDGEMTIKALSSMHRVFDGQVSVLNIRNMDGEETQNTVALTGPFEGLQEQWSAGLPANLRHLAESYTWEKHVE